MMPKKLLRFLTLAVLLGAALGAIPAHAAQPALSVRIDGQLDDAAWQKARALETFQTLDGQKPKAATTGLAMTDTSFLYLAFRCDEPMMDKLQTTPLPRDGAVYNNDCIEVFIAPFEDQNKFYHLIVDASGQIYDALNSGGKEDNRYELSVIAKAQKQPDGWTLEMAIPLCDVALTNAREALMNFGRERKPVSELSSWHGLFAQPKTWQTLPLSPDKKQDVDVRDWNFGALQYGENELALEFTASSGAPLGVLLQTQENEKWQNNVRLTAQSTPALSKRVALPYALSPQHKPQSIRLVLERGGVPLFRVTRRLSLPAEALVPALSVPYYYAEENFGFVRLENFLSPAGLQKSHLRLTIKNPAGKVVASREIRDLRPMMRAGFDISSWRNGNGTLTAELLSDGQTLSRRTVIIEKRPGPFSMLAGR